MFYAKDANFILLVLPTGKEVLETINQFDDYKGIIIDMTTLGYDELDEIKKIVSKKKLNYISSKIERGPADAEAGKLILYVGGDESLFNKSIDLLKDMGDFIYVGSDEQANLVKLISTLLLTANTLLLAEISLIHDKIGIDKEILLKALSMGGADSVQLRSRFPMIINNSYKEVFSISLGSYVAEKMIEFMRKEGINYTPLLTDVTEILKFGRILGTGNKDIAEIATLYKKLNH
ncbi:MAG: NAD(P)-binding domain-containing protein [Caldisphaera sp.]